MNTLLLKILAAMFMLIDHIGYFTDNAAFRIIGRLSFPIFAFLIANGFKYTKNVYKYAARLLVFAFVSEFAFDFAFNKKISFIEFNGLFPDIQLDNVFFTLFISLCFLILNSFLKKNIKNHWLISVPLLFVMSFVATFISADYGALGVLWVVLFGVFDVEDKSQRIPLVACTVLLAVWRILIRLVTAVLGVSTSHILFVNAFIYSGQAGFMDKIQCFSTLAIIPILLYNGKNGAPKAPAMFIFAKYFFYIFYPLHILLLTFIFR